MKAHYPIDKSFGLFARFTPPLGRAALLLSRPILALLPKGLRGVCAERVEIPAGGSRKVRAYLLGPKGEGGSLPCLVYFHGGGFVFGAAPYHYRNAVQYVQRAGCRLLLVDYRLAPAHPYPQPDRDCLAAYKWVTENAAALHIDGVALGGDSAGGCLAANLVRQIEREHLPGPRFLMLLYPVLDRRMQSPSMQAYTDTPMWNARLNERMWRYYCTDPQYLSPAQWQDVGYFPPSYIETAQYDCLHDEGVLFAEKLRGQGVPVTLRETRGTMHGYDIARRSPVTAESLGARCAALRAALFAGSEDAVPPSEA